MKLISFGRFNKYHMYSIFSIIFMKLKDVITGYNYNDSFITVFKKDNRGLYNKGNLINYIFCYIGTFILSLIFYIFETKNYRRNSKKSKKEEEKKLNDKELLEGKIVYLHYEKNKNFIYSKNTFYIFLLLIFLWILEEHLIEIFVCLKDLDFWAFEIIITSLLNSKMFHLEIYRHHILVYIINVIPIILKIFPIILSFIDEGNNNNNNNDNNEYCYNNTKNDEGCTLKNLYVIFWWLVPAGFFTYIGLITLRAFVNSKLKWFMDLRYMSGNKILMIYGLLGIILCSIVCTFTTLLECEETTSNNKNLYDYICVVKDTINNTDNNSTTHLKYFDNFKSYFTNLNLFELTIFFQIIFFFLNKYFSILIIKYLTPVHLILSIPAYYIIQKIILIINTLIRNQNFSIFNDKREYNFRVEKLVFDSSGDLVSIIGLFIYLEIIELNFCKLNYNLRRNIITRGSNELYNYIENDEEESMDDVSIGSNSKR